MRVYSYITKDVTEYRHSALKRFCVQCMVMAIVSVIVLSV